jgi:hypothetical protein
VFSDVALFFEFLCSFPECASRKYVEDMSESFAVSPLCAEDMIGACGACLCLGGR